MQARDDYPTYARGDTVVVPLGGAPFRYICCDCERTHDLYFAMSGGRLLMQVFNNDGETLRLRALAKEGTDGLSKAE